MIPLSLAEQWIASMKRISQTSSSDWFCHFSILGSILSVSSDIKLSEASRPQVSFIVSEICFVVIPLAYIEMILRSIFQISFWRFFTILGSKVDLRSCTPRCVRIHSFSSGSSPYSRYGNHRNRTVRISHIPDDLSSRLPSFP